ncbi:MAG: hypothetical protein ABSH41_27440 [Syntrophobacteraceae bacterium]|jgi:hypothetical protein
MKVSALSREKTSRIDFQGSKITGDTGFLLTAPGPWPIKMNSPGRAPPWMDWLNFASNVEQVIADKTGGWTILVDGSHLIFL